MIAVLWMVIKRLVRNWVLALAMLVGLVTSVSIAAGISLYSDGALQRLLEGRFSYDGNPGVIVFNYTAVPSRHTNTEQYKAATAFIDTEMPRILNLPIGHVSRQGDLEMQKLEPVDPRQDTLISRFGQLRFLSNLWEHIELIDGELPQGRKSPGHPVEAVVDEQTLFRQDMLVGETYRYPLLKVADSPEIEVKIVGAFRALSGSAPWWYRKPPLLDGLYVLEETFFDDVLRIERTRPFEYYWYYTFDHQKLKFTDVDRIADGLNEVRDRTLQYIPDVRLDVSPLSVLTAFQNQGFYLRLLRHHFGVAGDGHGVLLHGHGGWHRDRPSGE